MPRGIPNKKVTPEEDDLATIGAVGEDDYKVSGDEPDEEEDTVLGEEDEEPLQEYPIASEQPDEDEVDDEAEELAAAGMHIVEEEDEPDEYDAIVGNIRKAIQTYQEWLRKGVSPDTAFFESKLHDAIKDVKVEDWF